MGHPISVTLHGMLFLIGTVIVLLSIFCLPSMADTLVQQNPAFAFLRTPLLFGTYVTLIPFLLALLGAWRIIRTGFSMNACKSLTHIKWHAILIAGIYVAGIIFLLLHHVLHPGKAVIGISILLICLGIAKFAVFLHRLFLQALSWKAE
ncbi:Protein of unknown function [Terribacillus halophilus]|uniref:DUF2975 domain-containing protein n=1 Tax=Terribacillus halophilus TaxID=361279 RepID=A0A1G6LFX2_9BACI|nr:DUF2975 domain-containing protein [Terribacillus halophilus]SDC42129.1 Protein of unknown function [Terribacillus halophilus]